MAQKDKFAPRTWEDLRPLWTRLQRRLKSWCGGLLDGAESVQLMHQTAKEFLSRSYLWDLIFPKHMGFLDDEAKDLAILSGLVGRLKCCQEVTYVALEAQQEPWRRLDFSTSSFEDPVLMVLVCRLLYNCFEAV